MISNKDLTIECLNRAIEIVRNSQHATSIHIEVDSDLETIPTLKYDITELAPNKEN